MKKVFAIISILILLTAVYGLYLFSKKTPSLENVAPDYVVSADALFNEFDTNEPNAIKKYQGKVLQVSGKVMMFSKTDSISNIVLHAEDALMGGINCSFTNLTKDIQKDDFVKIKGECQGYLTSVILNNCLLEK